MFRLTVSLGAVTLEIRQRSSTSITVGWTQASGTVTHYDLQVAHKERGVMTSMDTIDAYVTRAVLRLVWPFDGIVQFFFNWVTWSPPKYVLPIIFS